MGKGCFKKFIPLSPFVKKRCMLQESSQQYQMGLRCHIKRNKQDGNGKAGRRKLFLKSGEHQGAFINAYNSIRVLLTAKMRIAGVYAIGRRNLKLVPQQQTVMNSSTGAKPDGSYEERWTFVCTALRSQEQVGLVWKKPYQRQNGTSTVKIHKLSPTHRR